MDIFPSLTIINSVAIALLPLIFFRRQKLQEIKYKELMELNVKVHDITKRADNSLSTNHRLFQKDYDRLDYLISRYKKHSRKLSLEIEGYKNLWDSAIKKCEIRGKANKVMSKNWLNKTKNNLLKKSESIRELADKLLK